MVFQGYTLITLFERGYNFVDCYNAAYVSDQVLAITASRRRSQKQWLARAIADAKVCLMNDRYQTPDAATTCEMRTRIRELQRKLGLTMLYHP